MYTGPNIERDGLVFGYDTHDYSRFYNGPATTNHLLSLNTSFSNTVNTNGKAVAGSEEVNIPTIGKRTVKYVEYYNNHNNAGSLGCCPNLFNYHGGGVVPLVGSQSYTYSIVYKHTGGYTHPNFMYRYRYKADNTYIGESGLHSTARRTHLGGGWYHAWGSWVTDPDANYGRFYSFLYNYGTAVHRYYVAAISLVKNNSGSEHLIIPPNLLLEPNTSISSTNSILDLTKTTNIEVSNVSFNPTGQPTFDGTDDYISLPNDLGYSTNSVSVFAWFKINGSPTGGYHIICGTSNLEMSIHSSATYLRNGLETTNGRFVSNNGNQTLNDGNYHYYGFTFDGSTKTAYIDGVVVGTQSVTGTLTTSFSTRRVGAYGGSYFANGDLPVYKVYDKVLTPEEVTQTYNSYKNRFDI